MAAWALEAKDLPDTPAVALEPLPGSDKPCRSTTSSSTAHETSDIIAEMKRVRIVHNEPCAQHVRSAGSTLSMLQDKEGEKTGQATGVGGETTAGERHRIPQCQPPPRPVPPPKPSHLMVAAEASLVLQGGADRKGEG